MMYRSIHLHHRTDDEPTYQALELIERRRSAARAQVPVGYERYFQDQARFLSAYSSVSIEGNPLDFQAVQLALIEGEQEDPNRREARNATEAVEFATEIAGDPTLRIDEGLIRTCNSILLKGLPGRAAEHRGRYRAGGAMIMDMKSGNIHYTAPPAEWLPELMRSLIQRIGEWQEQDPPEIAAAKAHFGLVSIHPFGDGNGRTSRLIADLILHQTRRSADGMLSITSVLLDRREEYYAALRASQGPEFLEHVDITAFLRFHTESLAWAVTRLEERATLLRGRQLALSRTFGTALNPRRVVGLMYMLDLGPLSTSAYAMFAGCSQPTALSDLNELAKLGAVERLGRGRNTRYELRTAVRELLNID